MAALKSERDISVRQRAVDLLYAMCDRGNAEDIVSEMLAYLESADYAIREEMVLKVRFKENILSAFIGVISIRYIEIYRPPLLVGLAYFDLDVVITGCDFGRKICIRLFMVCRCHPKPNSYCRRLCQVRMILLHVLAEIKSITKPQSIKRPLIVYYNINLL